MQIHNTLSTVIAWYLIVKKRGMNVLGKGQINSVAVAGGIELRIFAHYMIDFGSGFCVPCNVLEKRRKRKQSDANLNVSRML